MRLRNGGGEPEAGLESHFCQLFCEMLHAGGKPGVCVPFTVAVLPAVVDDDALDVLGENGIFCDEFGVLQHFVLGDGPAVVVPAVPARGGGGELFLDVAVFIRVGVHEFKAVAGGAEGDDGEDEFGASVVVRLHDETEIADLSLFGDSLCEDGEACVERSGDLHGDAVFGDGCHDLSGECGGFRHIFQIVSLAAAHLDVLRQNMVRMECGELEESEVKDVGFLLERSGDGSVDASVFLCKGEFPGAGWGGGGECGAVGFPDELFGSFAVDCHKGVEGDCGKVLHLELRLNVHSVVLVFY